MEKAKQERKGVLIGVNIYFLTSYSRNSKIDYGIKQTMHVVGP